MSKKPKPAKPANEHTAKDFLRGLLEVVGLLIILALVIVLFVKLVPTSSRSGIYTVTAEISHTDGDPITYQLQTSMENLSDALTDGGLMVVGDDGAVTLDGETADWTLTVNGEETNAAWADIPLTSGDAFAFSPAE